MRVLFFTYDFPYPTNSGGKMRAYNLLKYAGKNAEISLFSFVREGFDSKNIEALKDIGIKNITVIPRRSVRSLKNLSGMLSGKSIFKSLYFSSVGEQKLGEIIEKEKINILHFESFYTAFYLHKRFHEQGIKQIYGSENIEYKLYEDYVRQRVLLPLKLFYQEQVRRVKKEELWMAQTADMTLAVTPTEQAFFEKHTKHPVRVVENGVSVDEFEYRERKRKDTITALFVGNFSYFPNKTAVEFFYTHVLKALPDPALRFLIVGKGSSQFHSLGDSRIQTEEFVKDIKDAYYASDIFVSPVHIGGGTNFKILEAMATGLPVVTFSARVAEIGAKNEEEVLTADTGEAFRQAVEKLLVDEKLGIQLGRNARKIIEEKYAWEGIGKRLSEAWKELYEDH